MSPTLSGCSGSSTQGVNSTINASLPRVGPIRGSWGECTRTQRWRRRVDSRATDTFNRNKARQGVGLRCGWEIAVPLMWQCRKYFVSGFLLSKSKKSDSGSWLTENIWLGQILHCVGPLKNVFIIKVLLDKRTFLRTTWFPESYKVWRRKGFKSLTFYNQFFSISDALSPHYYFCLIYELL